MVCCAYARTVGLKFNPTVNYVRQSAPFIMIAASQK